MGNGFHSRHRDPHDGEQVDVELALFLSIVRLVQAWHIMDMTS